MLNLHLPDAAQRLTIWRNSIPEKAPVAQDVEPGLKALADNLELSGSAIKSAALQAAYFAASEGSPITLRHLVKACEKELAKLGKSLSAHVKQSLSYL